MHWTGLQALARLPLEQIRRDRTAGLRVGGYISGYPGSPLAGFDTLLGRIGPLLAEHDLRFDPGVNEELAAAAVSGSQLLDLLPHRRFDGAIGLWFGKAPGVDRCLDVFRHANFAGISRFGGALAVAGDDPACKSSSLPSQSELAFAHAWMPVLVPADAAEVLSLGLHAYALSRFAGLWVGFKLVADVCDGGAIIELPLHGCEIRVPEIEGFEKRLDPRLLPPMVLGIEHDLIYARREAALQYVFENELDRIQPGADRDRDQIGIVAAGTHRRELASALARLGIDRAARERLGLRLLELSMVSPIEPRRLREFAHGLEQVVVLDDRRGFLEQQVRALLLDLPSPPRVFGERDTEGRPWLAARGAIEAERLAEDLGVFLAEVASDEALSQRVRTILQATESAARPAELASLPVRRPHFCSGCPHLTSTRLPGGALAAGGIGCHTMVLLTDREMRFHGAMGSEGAAWNGLAPFVEAEHFFQNLGDGTYFHSGRQAVRACVEAGHRITFKLLYNGAVAMTGGQRAAGEKPLARLVADLISDGVGKVVAVSTDPAVIGLARVEPRVEIATRDDSLDAQSRLVQEEGVSVFVYDELCANEKQRRQRRGQVPGPERRVVIQRDVCEGCGDCGKRADCLSLRPVPTTLGRKTEIHQDSCSQDEACLEGDCPAFLTVEGDLRPRPLNLPPALADDPPEPELPPLDSAFSVLMVGIGSTGVVTVDAILVEAARRAGLFAIHLDQTGLSQRGGRVTSHLQLASTPVEGSARVLSGQADTLLAFDPLGSAQPASLRALDPSRSVTVMQQGSAPTAAMVAGDEAPLLDSASLEARLAEHSHALHALPAEELCLALLGSSQSTNVLLLGFAFQRGALPLPDNDLEAAIRENGVAVENNLQAFRLGRRLAARPECWDEILRAARPPSVGERGRPGRAFELYGGLWQEIEALLGRATLPESGEELACLVAGWCVDLRDYQNHAYGARYLRTLLPLLREERAFGGRIDGDPSLPMPLVAVAAREAYRLMAYKDEYEVARLHLRGPYRRWLEERMDGPLRASYWLHPPFLRALGLRKKLRFGPAFEPLLRGLAALRFLRGTPFDPFGCAEARQLERSLVGWYEGLLQELAERLEGLGVEAAARIAAHAGEIRGYEDLKRQRASAVQERVEKELDGH